jgi:hypothetical protein
VSSFPQLVFYLVFPQLAYPGGELANPRFGQQNAGRTVRHVSCRLYTEPEVQLRKGGFLVR